MRRANNNELGSDFAAKAGDADTAPEEPMLPPPSGDAAGTRKVVGTVHWDSRQFGCVDDKRCALTYGDPPPLLLLDPESCRDPKGKNRHCLVKFEDIIAEPDPTVFSFNGVWTVSYKVFTSTKLWCYRITSLICAVPAAICWGIEFACLSFCTIWCWQPSLKAYEISLWFTRRLFEICLSVFVEPCFHAAGKCLSHIVVTVKREG